MHNINNTNNAQFDDKNPPASPKVFAFVFSPKIAIFVLSCKEIRRRRRRNGQAGARPCKMTVGDAGTETENRCNSLIYIGLTFVRKHLYPALFSLLLETFL